MRRKEPGAAGVRLTVLAVVLGAIAMFALGTALTGCSGRHTVLTPVGSIESEPAPAPPNPEVAEVQAAVPRGMSLSIETDEAAPGEVGSPPSVVLPASNSVTESASPTPPIDPSVIQVMQTMADALLAAVTSGSDASVAGMSAANDLARTLTGAPVPDPQPEAFVGPPEPVIGPVAASGALAELTVDKSGFHPDSAAQQARAVLGADEFDGFTRARQEAWMVVCHYVACELLQRARDASLSGDWATAADALALRLRGAGRDRQADAIDRWLRSGSH